jgi:hypothetical protein
VASRSGVRDEITASRTPAVKPACPWATPHSYTGSRPTVKQAAAPRSGWVGSSTPASQPRLSELCVRRGRPPRPLGPRSHRSAGRRPPPAGPRRTRAGSVDQHQWAGMQLVSHPVKQPRRTDREHPDPPPRSRWPWSCPKRHSGKRPRVQQGNPQAHTGPPGNCRARRPVLADGGRGLPPAVNACNTTTVRAHQWIRVSSITRQQVLNGHDLKSQFHSPTSSALAVPIGRGFLRKNGRDGWCILADGAREMAPL